MKNALAIICSRLKSSRIQEKAFKRIAGRPAIEHIIRRLQQAGIKMVIAVPDQEQVEYQTRLAHTGVDIVPGNAASPLHRMINVARQYDNPKWIIRITHDDIFIDGKTAIDLLEKCEAADAGYGVTPGIMEGAGVEVIRFENLEYAAAKRKEPTEFVSYFVRGEGLPFPGIVRMAPRPNITRDYRLTMDYPQDAQAIEVVLRATGPDVSVDTICYHIDHHPYILNINRLPDFSFYTCTHNSGGFIEQTMMSVLGSDIPNMEYIVVDDYSTDGTLGHIAKHFSDPRMRPILNEENKGLATSSNIAISACRGKYIMRVDADDLILPSNFSTHLWTLRNKIDAGSSVVYPAFYEMDETGFRTEKIIDPAINHHVGCALMSKAVVNEFRFRDGLRHWDGLELYSRMGAKAEYFMFPLWLYRRHNKSMSANDRGERARIAGQLGLDGEIKIKGKM